MNTYKLPQVYLKILKDEDYKLILDLYSNKETAYWSGIKKIQSKQAAEDSYMSQIVIQKLLITL